MILTFAVEMALAIFISVKRHVDRFRWLAVALLACLGMVQIAEFFVCQGPPRYDLFWSKFGLVAISLLPAFGMDLIASVTRRSWVVPVSYAGAACYAVAFVFWPGAALPAACEGNYVIFHMEHGFFGEVYEFYYLGFVVLAMIDLVLRLHSKTPFRLPFSKLLVGVTLLAYLAFTVPLAVVDIVDASLRKATPSIMCGFALFFALILALWIVPLHVRETTGKGVGA